MHHAWVADRLSRSCGSNILTKCCGSRCFIVSIGTKILLSGSDLTIPSNSQFCLPPCVFLPCILTFLLLWINILFLLWLISLDWLRLELLSKTTFALRADEIVPCFGRCLFLAYCICEVAVERRFGHRFATFWAAGVFWHFSFPQWQVVEVSVPSKGLVLGEHFAACLTQVISQWPDTGQFFWSALWI